MPIIERRASGVKGKDNQGKDNQEKRSAGSPDFFPYLHPQQGRWETAPLLILHVENLIDNPIPECEYKEVFSSQLAAIKKRIYVFVLAES